MDIQELIGKLKKCIKSAINPDVNKIEEIIKEQVV